MPLFARRPARRSHAVATTTHTHRRHFWQRRDPDRVAGGYSTLLGVSSAYDADLS